MRWDKGKSERLKRERGVSFDEIIHAELRKRNEITEAFGWPLLGCAFAAFRQSTCSTCRSMPLRLAPKSAQPNVSVIL